MTPTNAVTEQVQKRKKRKRGGVENSQKAHESTVTSSLDNNGTQPSIPTNLLDKGAMSKVAARKRGRWTQNEKKRKKRESTNVTSSNSELSSDNNEINPSKTLGFLEKGRISGAAATEEPQKSKKKKRKKNRKSTNATFSNPEPSAHDNGINPSKPSFHNEETKPSKPLTFLEKMKARLSAGHFRMLNERLYTCTGTEALNYFKENPELFNKYHEGYQEQMSHWPELPVNSVVKWLKDRDSSLVVADFGCGDARLAKNVKNKVYSIDLVASDPSVIACDMSKTPLDSSSVDVAVFCLSLMGTDFPSYLLEAHRVLKPSGWLLIAEVKSRFDTNTGGADPDKFERAICQLGFSTSAKDFSNKMFIMLYFKKKDDPTSQKEIEWPELKPCLYKRR